MTEQQHMITPPPELFRQWEGMPRSLAFEAAYRAGADQELEACVKWIEDCRYHPSVAEDLRAARRSKPPSLAKQGCDALDTYIYGNPNHKDKERTYNTIRAALERLQELESNG